MSISVGDTLPKTGFQIVSEAGVRHLSTGDVFSGKRVVLFGMPGAFTPACEKQHLPDILAQLEGFEHAGIDTVAVTSTNDAFVLAGWSKQQGADGVIQFLGDGNGDFARAIGLSFDAHDRLMGIRSQRYALVVEDGVVTQSFVENSPLKVDAASAKNVVASLNRPMKKAA